MRLSPLPLFLSLVLFGFGCASEPVEDRSTTPSSSPSSMSTPPRISSPSFDFPGILPPEEITNRQVHIQTPKGEIIFELFADTAPKAVSSFVYLTRNRFFDGLTFHRFVDGFVIQGGDPLGNGTGGPGYTFEDELTDPFTYERGMVAMANRGPNTNGSQFFIMLANNPLPKQYTIFGRVVRGMEVVDLLRAGDEMTTVTIEAK